jgi:hypothetical protein
VLSGREVSATGRSFVQRSPAARACPSSVIRCTSSVLSMLVRLEQNERFQNSRELRVLGSAPVRVLHDIRGTVSLYPSNSCTCGHDRHLDDDEMSLMGRFEIHHAGFKQCHGSGGVGGLSSRRPGFDLGPVGVIFVVDRVALGQYLHVFPRYCYSTNTP